MRSWYLHQCSTATEKRITYNPGPYQLTLTENRPWISNHFHCSVRDVHVGINHCGPNLLHDDVIKWKHFPRHRPFVRGIHRSSVNSPQKGQWRGDLIFSLICTWINGWVSNCEASDFRSHRAHYDFIVMMYGVCSGGRGTPTPTIHPPNYSINLCVLKHHGAPFTKRD